MNHGYRVTRLECLAFKSFELHNRTIEISTAYSSSKLALRRGIDAII